jgi:hypothetical protein
MPSIRTQPCDADVAQNLIRRYALKHRSAIGVKLAIICVPAAQIARILVVVGRRIHGLRRSDTRRRQHNSRGDDSGDFASHIVLHPLPALGSGRMGPNLHPSLVNLCGIDAFGIAKIAKGLFGWAKQSAAKDRSRLCFGRHAHGRGQASVISRKRFQARLKGKPRAACGPPPARRSWSGTIGHHGVEIGILRCPAVLPFISLN